MNNYWQKYDDIYEELCSIKDLVIEVNKTSEPYLNESIDYLASTGGKMLRPAFFMIASRFGTGKLTKEELVKRAAVIEMLHLATLIHDDIIDEAKLRRGKPSIQAKYSKEYAVYMGDYLFTQCFVMMAEQSYSPENLKRAARAISRVCLGEMLQSKFRYETSITTRDYLKIISGKTAALFAMSLGIGAYESGAEEAVAKTLGRIGYNVGMAFQIKDDLLDYKGDDEVVGKETKLDILRGFYTLPIIRGLKTDSKGQIEKLLSSVDMGDAEVKALIAITKGCGALDEAEELAGKYTVRAMKHLESLPEGEGKDVLMDIIPKLLNREH